MDLMNRALQYGDSVGLHVRWTYLKFKSYFGGGSMSFLTYKSPWK